MGKNKTEKSIDIATNRKKLLGIISGVKEKNKHSVNHKIKAVGIDLKVNQNISDFDRNEFHNEYYYSNKSINSDNKL